MVNNHCDLILMTKINEDAHCRRCPAPNVIKNAETKMAISNQLDGSFGRMLVDAFAVETVLAFNALAFECNKLDDANYGEEEV